MTPEKWLDTKNTIKDKFEVQEEGDLHLDEEGGIDIEFIEFESPMGKIRLEYVSRAVVLDKKTNYSKRIGSETQVEYVYSEDEKSHSMIAYKWNEAGEDWDEIESSALASL